MTTTIKNLGKVETNKFWNELKTEYFERWETDDCIIQGNGKNGLQVIFVPKTEMRKLLKIASKQKKNGFV